MNAGLLADWDDVRLDLTLASTISRTANAPGIVNTAQLVTKWDENPAALSTGVLMTCQTGYFLSVPPGEKWSYSLIMDWHPDWTGSAWTRSGDGHKASMDQHLIFENVRLYMLPSGHYRLIVDAVKWYVEDVLEETLSGFEMLSVGSIAAALVPVIGVPAQVSALSVPSALPVEYADGEQIDCVEGVTGDVTPSSMSGTGSASAGGGWNFTLATVPYNLPINIDTLAPPAGSGCPFALALPSLSGSVTDGVSATADCSVAETIALIGDEECGLCPDGTPATPPMTVRWWSREGHAQVRSSGAMALPDLPKAVRRLQDVADDYEALIERYQFPLAEARALRTCADLSWSGCPCPSVFYDSTLVAAQKNAAHAPRIEVVDEDPKDIEAALGEASYAPYGQNAKRIAWKTFIGRVLAPGGCQVPPPGGGPGGSPVGCCTPQGASGYYRYEDVASTFPAIIMQGGEIGLYEHNDPQAAYINFHAHPHASLLYHFPPDTDTVNWKALGSKRTSEDYWLRIRQQYSHLDSVPRYVGASTKRRPDLVTAPLLSALSSVISSAFALVRTFWWGVSRFSLDERAPLASIAVTDASADRWSATDATITVQADGVMLHPTDTTPVLEFDLGDLGVPPYLYSQAAKQVTLPAFPANVSSVNVYLEGQGGDRVLLGAASGTHSKPTSGADSVYAGTWAQNFLLTSGADVLPGGVSDATFESVERVHTPELIVGMTAAKLVYEFTLASTADTLIGFPTFLFATTDSGVVHETGQASALLWEDAPGIRYGQMDVYDTVARAYRPVPLYRPPGSLMSAVDYIAWRNLLYDAQGVDAGSESELALWFDDTELGWPDNPREFGAAIDTMVVPRKVTGKVGAQWLVVNAVREVFPLACFPQKERDATSLAFVSPIAFDQRSYSMAIAPKRYVSRSVNLDLAEEGAVGPLTGASSLAVPSPWLARQHNAALTNEEDPDRIMGDMGGAGERQYAQGRRWHGYVGLLGSPSAAGAFSLASSRAMNFHRLIERDGNLWYGRAGNDLPKAWVDFDTALAAPTEASLAVNNLIGRVFLLRIDGGQALLRYTDSNGDAWSVDTDLGAADHGAVEVTQDGNLLVLLASGGSVVLRVYDGRLNLRNSVTVAAVSPSAVALSALAERVYAVTVEGGNVLLRLSTNGGDTFAAPVTIGAGGRAAIDALHAGGCAILYAAPSVQYARVDQDGNIVDTGTALTLDDEAYDVAECVVGRGEWRLAVLGVRDGDLAFLTSADLTNWS